LHDPKLWEGAQQYITLSEPVAAAITLCGDSAYLSDAVFLMVSTRKHVNGASLELYSHLFESEHQVADLQHRWNERAKSAPFFSTRTSLRSSTTLHGVFNLWFFDYWISWIEEFAQQRLLKVRSDRLAWYGWFDTTRQSSFCCKVVESSLCEAASKLFYLLPSKPFVGAHATKKLKHLGVSNEQLNECRIDDEPPVSFWEHQVPAHCLVRDAGYCVMSAKPSSTAVERLWHAFGDNLSAKRCSMKNETLATVVYAQMNMLLLDCSQSQ
jgi:hypothetical protein